MRHRKDSVWWISGTELTKALVELKIDPKDREQLRCFCERAKIPWSLQTLERWLKSSENNKKRPSSNYVLALQEVFGNCKAEFLLTDTTSFERKTRKPKELQVFVNAYLNDEHVKLRYNRSIDLYLENSHGELIGGVMTALKTCLELTGCSRNYFFVIAGEFGTGKTTICQKLAYDLAAQWSFDQDVDHVPLLVSARHLPKPNGKGSVFSEETISVEAFVESLHKHILEKFPISLDTLADIFKSKSVILVVDRIDDLERDQVKNAIVFFEQLASEGIPIVLACWPSTSKLLESSGATTARIRRMSNEKIVELTNSNSPNALKIVCRILEGKMLGLSSLVRRPYYLNQLLEVSQINSSSATQEIEGGSTNRDVFSGTELLSLFAEHLVNDVNYKQKIAKEMMATWQDKAWDEFLKWRGTAKPQLVLPKPDYGIDIDEEFKHFLVARRMVDQIIQKQEGELGIALFHELIFQFMAEQVQGDSKILKKLVSMCQHGQQELARMNCIPILRKVWPPVIQDIDVIEILLERAAVDEHPLIRFISSYSVVVACTRWRDGFSRLDYIDKVTTVRDAVETNSIAKAAKERLFAWFDIPEYENIRFADQQYSVECLKPFFRHPGVIEAYVTVLQNQTEDPVVCGETIRLLVLILAAIRKYEAFEWLGPVYREEIRHIVNDYLLSPENAKRDEDLDSMLIWGIEVSQLRWQELTQARANAQLDLLENSSSRRIRKYVVERKRSNEPIEVLS